MPCRDFFPEELKELSLKNALEFSIVYFENYLDRIEKNYLTSAVSQKNKAKSVFKFYSDKDCKIYQDGKLICNLEKFAEEPYYLPVQRKGEYRFKCIFDNGGSLILNSNIDLDEEKIIHIKRKNRVGLLYITSALIVVLLNVAMASYLFIIQSTQGKNNMALVKKSSPKEVVGSTITELHQVHALHDGNIKADDMNGKIIEETDF